MQEIEAFKESLYNFDGSATIQTHLDLNSEVTLKVADLVAMSNRVSDNFSSLTYTLDNRIEQSMQNERLLAQQTKMAAMGEMIGAIAHQWRQPLNALGLLVQELQFSYLMGSLDSASMSQSVKDALEQIKFMSKTIDDFRNFFRQDRDKETFDLSFLIGDVTRLLRAQLLASNIAVVIDGDMDLIIEGYPNELRQTLFNLFSNSKDAFEGMESKYRLIKILITKEDEDECKINFSDNAGGCSPDALSRIFEPYFTTKPQGKGTGIGLYMSKVIIEGHFGGKLDVQNTQDGLEFVITLKCKLT